MIPKITAFELFKKSMIGFPILPIKLTGENGFSVKKSKFKWSCANVELVADARQQKNPRSEVWNVLTMSTCPEGELRPLTPNEALLGYIIRLTCTPRNEAGNQTGTPSSVETHAIIHPPIPISKFVFHERLSRMDAKKVGKGFFRAVTYNTLAEYFAVERFFQNSPKDSLPSDYRVPALCLELKAYEADIICMQEVDKRIFENYFEPYLSCECGMDGRLCVKTDERILKDGQATFFNRQKFEFVENNDVVLSEYMRTLDIFRTDSLSPRFKNELRTLINIFQVVVLKSNDNPNTLIVIGNSHHYSRPEGDHIRLLQTITAVAFLEAKVKDLKTRFPQLKSTVLFFGDLNCPANSPTTYGNGSFRYLDTGRVLADDPDWTKNEGSKVVPGISIQHTLNFTNSHPEHHITNVVPHFKECIDYIFYQAESVKLLKAFPPPLLSKLAELCGVEETNISLPNFFAPSDHLPLVVDFCFQT